MSSTRDTNASRARWGLWAAQAGLTGAVAWFVWRRVAADLRDFDALGLETTLSWGRIGIAALVVLATYGMLIAAWRAVLRGWHQHLSYPTALQIWCVSNLGRYLPGKIWSVAGMAVLATRRGVDGWAATGSALVMQVLAVGTGSAVALAFLPQTESRVPLVVGLVTAVLGVSALTSKKLMRLLASLLGKTDAVRELSTGAVLVGGGATLAAWISYGIAFWLLAGGVLPGGAPPAGLAIGAFSAGYIVGLLAVFAPGGVVVREGVLVALLAPTLGTGPALVVSVASRILLTGTEIAAAMVGLAIRQRDGVSV